MPLPLDLSLKGTQRLKGVGFFAIAGHISSLVPLFVPFLFLSTPSRSPLQPFLGQMVDGRRQIAPTGRAHASQRLSRRARRTNAEREGARAALCGSIFRSRRASRGGEIGLALVLRGGGPEPEHGYRRPLAPELLHMKCW